MYKIPALASKLGMGGDLGHHPSASLSLKIPPNPIAHRSQVQPALSIANKVLEPILHLIKIGKIRYIVIGR